MRQGDGILSAAILYFSIIIKESACMRWITRDRNYYHSLIALAIPVALQSLITFLVSFADNLMVNSLGDAAVSGV